MSAALTTIALILKVRALVSSYGFLQSLRPSIWELTDGGLAAVRCLRCTPDEYRKNCHQ
jgi:hypothetical protein